LIDCGASRHFSPNRELFKSFSKISPKPIQCADRNSIDAIGEGDMEIELPNGNK
ncbi:hypothetical protein FIBSPDRAFT_688152, partial [Athelia psychrophila]